MDSAQSILPNIVTFLGLIPFLLVMFLDMLRIGKCQIFKMASVMGLHPKVDVLKMVKMLIVVS